ncbi:MULTISPECIES: type II toxin-antitoxin system RelE/ParE family toxin [unclassified Duganella]|uniref:type II toxin-antitoxin system RelE/ParE family toxin n=1 Tax=unclassified Duganella TaxID=2636909 RepID=UPI000B7D87B9|nr:MULTISPECIES: type II toxin-antitoxin system RelE/ParE family toxin [unclassified Duganella]
MLPVIWSPIARAKLKLIIQYIAERSPSAAAALHAELVDTTNRLPHHPLLYRRGKMPGTREIVVHHHYIIVYRLRTTYIEILSVLHARQQYP